MILDFFKFPSGLYVAINQIRYMQVVDIDNGKDIYYFIGLKAKEDGCYISIGSKERYDTKDKAQAELDIIFKEVCKIFSK